MIIGLGYQKQVGKDTVANYLIKRYGFKKSAFAAPLKELVTICNKKEGFNEGLNYWAERYGLSKEHEIYDLLFARKFCENWRERDERGKQRKFLQWLGTDIFRNKVDKDFWIGAMRRQILHERGADLVITDVRFPNEAELLEQEGYLVRVTRGIALTDLHKSETALQNYDFPYIITNNDTFSSLYNQVDELYSSILDREIKKKEKKDA